MRLFAIILTAFTVAGSIYAIRAALSARSLDDYLKRRPWQ